MGNKFIDPQKKQKGKRGKGGGRFRAFNCYISYLDIRPKPLSTTSQVFFPFPPPKRPVVFLETDGPKGKSPQQLQDAVFLPCSPKPPNKKPRLASENVETQNCSPVPFSRPFLSGILPLHSNSCTRSKRKRKNVTLVFLFPLLSLVVWFSCTCEQGCGGTNRPACGQPWLLRCG